MRTSDVIGAMQSLVYCPRLYEDPPAEKIYLRHCLPPRPRRAFFSSFFSSRTRRARAACFASFYREIFSVFYRRDFPPAPNPPRSPKLRNRSGRMLF